MAHKTEYDEAMITTLEAIWGKGFMAPGGEGHIKKMIEGLKVKNKRILDIGSGLGGPAFVLAGKSGAHVIGLDIEEDLIDIAKNRAVDLGLESRTKFQLVNPGPLNFPDNYFDIVFISGALTQVAEKLEMYKECFRVLKTGGFLTCYDWMKKSGDFSEDMLYWFELEGLTYAMETPEEHEKLLQEAGFFAIEITDSSDWYKHRVKEEYEQLKGHLFPGIAELLGQEKADHFVENWRAAVVICEKGEMLQVYQRAQKP